jgi:hypothetical protein
MEQCGFLLGVRRLQAPRAGEEVDGEGGLPELIHTIGAVAFDVFLHCGVLLGRECAEKEQFVYLV